jgi:hypothetical protein
LVSEFQEGKIHRWLWQFSRSTQIRSKTNQKRHGDDGGSVSIDYYSSPRIVEVREYVING